jgi:hypothetical protein
MYVFRWISELTKNHDSEATMAQRNLFPVRTGSGLVGLIEGGSILMFIFISLNSAVLSILFPEEHLGNILKFSYFDNNDKIVIQP